MGKILLVLLWVSPFLSLGQGIRGTITAPGGVAVPYTNIYVAQLKKGTTSNAEGNYQLELPPGKWKVIFQNIGFVTVEIEVETGGSFTELSVQLEERRYRLSEIKVLASGEDPAWYVMRRAIAMAPFYQNQVSRYHCSVYLKGSGRFRKIPKIFRKTLEKQGVKANDVFSMESLSQVDFQLPDQLKQRVVALRSSGNDNNTSPMPMVTNSLYQASNYGVISPFDKQALQVYHFKLLGMFEDQGRLVNRIQVTPRRKGNDLFEGILNITEGYWSIHSADLTINLPMMKARMKQLYGPVDENTWMPVSLSFDIVFSGMGFAFDYQYVSSISDYQITPNPNLDHSFLERQRKLFSGEDQLTEPAAQPKRNSAAPQPTQAEKLLQKEELSNAESRKLQRLIRKEAEQNLPRPPLEIEERVTVDPKAAEADSAFWQTIRPIPLTEAEKGGFRRKDSLRVVQQTVAYRDSVRDNLRKFRVKHLLLGKTYSYHPQRSERRNTLTIPGVGGLDALSFNTVDGLRLNLPFAWLLRDTLGHSLSLKPEAGYAFARRKTDVRLDADFLYNGKKRATVGISAGSVTNDFNQFAGMPAFVNDVYSLWFERNYKKFFRKDFVSLRHQAELANGLLLSGSLEWASRLPLVNHSEYRVFDWEDRFYTANLPENTTVEEWQLSGSKSAGLELALSWTPRQRYLVKNGFKIPVPGRLPVFQANYRKGFPGVLGSATDFDFLRGGMRQRLVAGTGNVVEYAWDAGTFLNHKKMWFTDFAHFASDYAGLVMGSRGNSFKLLPYYGASTPRWFLQGHATFDSGRLLVKRLPLLGNTLLAEQLFVHLLHTDRFKYYTEVGYGLKYILAVFNAEVVAAFEKGQFRSAGFKIGLNLTP